MYKVCLNGGHFIGTKGKRTPMFEDGEIIHEAEQNYPVMFLIEKYLQYNGVRTRITNANINHDMVLSDRVYRSNMYVPDMYLSIHANATKENGWQTYAKGIETICHMYGGEGEKISRLIQHNLIEDTGMFDRGVKEGYNYIDGKAIYELKHTDAPAVLVELGFMDYKNEAVNMKNFFQHDVYAKAITKGVCKYFGFEAKFDITEYDKIIKEGFQNEYLKSKINTLESTIKE